MTDPSLQNRVRRTTWKTWLGRVCLLTATLSCLVLALEVGTRCLTKTSRPITVRDELIGARHLRSHSGKFYIEEIDDYVQLRFNNVGFRGPDRSIEKPAGTVRVAVMGDSMIAALAVVEKELMTTKLEQMLNASYPSTAWEVMNFGVSGASTAQQIALYRALVQKFDPDIVISCFFVGNDLTDNSHRLSNNPRIYFELDDDGSFRQLPHSVSRSRISRWLNTHSRFYVWQKRATQIARRNVRSATNDLKPGDWIYATQENDDLAHAWTLTSKAIETLHSEVTSQGRIFAVVVMPTASQIHTDHFQRLVASAPELTRSFDIDHPERRLRGVCDRIGVACWTMSDDFCRASPSRSQSVKVEWLFLNGCGHLNEQGNTTVAQSMHRFLSDEVDETTRLSFVNKAMTR